MSDPMRLALVGATGLVGRHVIEDCVGRRDLRLAAIARCEMPLPHGATMEMFVAEPANWTQIFEALRPRALICALGTTWKQAGEDEAAFRAVDYDLVLDTARHAKEHGCERMVVVSSVGADPHAKQFYLRVKGEVEKELGRVGFHRLDILRPGLLRGERRNDRRPAERLAIVASPLFNLLLHGKYAQYRAIEAETVARACVSLTLKPARGRFVHMNSGIERAARSLPLPVAETE